MAKHSPDEVQQLLQTIVTLFDEGKLKPPTTTIFELSGVVDMFRLVQKGLHSGKLVLHIPNDYVPEKCRPSEVWIEIRAAKRGN